MKKRPEMVHFLRRMAQKYQLGLSIRLDNVYTLHMIGLFAKTFY